MAAPPLSDELCQQAVDAVAAHGSISAASRAVGIILATFHTRVQTARTRGFEPKVQALMAGEKAAPPEGYKIKGTSTLYNKDGQVAAQWIKTDASLAALHEMQRIAIIAMCEEMPRARLIPPPKSCNQRLLTVYPIGDMHVGDLAWPEEVGNDYNIKIAEQLLTTAAAHLVNVAPSSEYAIIANVGDFFHVDNLKNQTSRSGNTLDMDTRYAAMIRAGIKMLRVVVESALGKHKQVKLINATGNHDDIGAIWLQQAFSLLYEKNPRVAIETKAGKFHYHEHGKCLVGVTHGDTGKPERLHGVMAADMPELWGRTKHRFWYTGHVHTKSVVEFPGVTWETFRTLAPNNAWAHGAGYRSGRDMNAIVLDSEHGEVARHRFDVSMLS